MSQEKLREELEKLWQDFKPNSRRMNVWRYCKTHGSINDEFMSLCNDPECYSCKIIKDNLTYKL